MTSKNTVAGVLTVALLTALSGYSAVTPEPTGTKQSDSGYFLSLAQKGQLIWSGQIKDEAGVWYDIWIVPGYVEPTRQMGTYLQRAGSDFAEYFQKQKYHDLAKNSGDAFEWAYDDCLTKFTAKGVPKAWGRYWSEADKRTSRRVFGWWFAYPWAFMESTVDTAVRVPLGLAGTLLGTAWGSAVVPGYYAVNSTVAGSWHLAVESVALPVAGYAWNTVISPPMALVGQKPAPSRVDGFWVKQLGATEAQTAKNKKKPITQKDVECLAQWGRALMAATQPSENRRQELQKQIAAERETLNKLQKSWADLGGEERKSVQSLGNDPSLTEIIRYLRDQGFDYQKTSQASIDVRRHLESINTLSPAEISRILTLLSSYPLTAVPAQPQTLRPKTDPVKDSVQVIKDIH